MSRRVFSLRNCLLVAGLAMLVTAIPAASAADANSAPSIDLSRPNAKPYYPASAQRSGEHGTAVVAVYVNAIGRPYKVVLATTSGYSDLDASAVDAVRGWHFVPAVRDGVAVSEWTAVGIKFDLAGVSTVAVPGDTAIANADRNRVICKSNVGMTGSNITQPQVCLPKWQWDQRERNDQNTLTRSPQVQGGGSPR